jgi:hypothetical protein
MSNELLKAMIAELRDLPVYESQGRYNSLEIDYESVKSIIEKYEAKMNNTIEKLPNGDFQVKPETPNPYHFDNNQILQDSCTPESEGFYEKL